MDCLRAQGECELFPEPPETVKAIAKAGDRRTALNQSYPNGSFGILPYEVEALVERGELVSRSRRMASQESLVLGKSFTHGAPYDLSNCWRSRPSGVSSRLWPSPPNHRSTPSLREYGAR
jgi:hypothetical protein